MKSPQRPPLTAPSGIPRPAPRGKDVKQERAVRTQERILRAAAEAFAGKGFPAVTILDVAELSGMTKGAVYFHYANKEALALSVADEFYRRIAVIADAVAELGVPPVPAVAELLLHTAVALRDDVVMQAGARLQIERAMIEAELPLPYQSYTQLICSWLTEAARLGELAPGADPEVLAQVLVSAFFGAQHMSWVLNDRADITERTRAIIRTIIPCAESPLLTRSASWRA
ncbi:TetR/AcrR family transcriptional regulator [Kitasatospora sp. NBC_01560]|uniref:ScbR family autoregulator-binding transcription factor n=1 Tax=Kitasatospora sp. NBC_01560 TaxID=2975965 RepID=UPI0038640ADB